MREEQEHPVHKLGGEKSVSLMRCSLRSHKLGIEMAHSLKHGHVIR